MGINKAILVGNLGRDPEVRYTSSQMPVCNFSIATTERRKDSSGQWNDHTEWHNIVTFGKTAENCKQYLKKGSQVFVEGRIQTRKWQDKEGRDRYTTEIVAMTVQFLGSRRSDGASAGGYSGMDEASASQVAAGVGLVNSLPSADALAANGGGAAASPDEVPFDDDDIPF